MISVVKEILITIGYALFANVSAILFFTLLYNIIGIDELFFLIGITVLFLEIVLYFVFEKKVIKKKKYNFKHFIITFILAWQMFYWSALFIPAPTFFPHEIAKIFLNHKCTVILCGLEYAVFWLGMQIQFIAIFLIKGIEAVYNKVKKSKSINEK